MRVGDKKALGNTFIALYYFSGLTTGVLSEYSGVSKNAMISWINDDAQPSSLNKRQANGLAEAFVGKSPQLASAISATLRSLQEEKTYSELLHDCIESAALEIRGHNATKRRERAPKHSGDHPSITRESIVAGQIGHFITEYRKMTKERQADLAKVIVYEKNGEKKSVCEYEVSTWQSGKKVLTLSTAEAFAKMLVSKGRIAEQEEEAATRFFAGYPRYYEKDLVTNWEGAWKNRDNSWRLRELRHNSGFPKYDFINKLHIGRDVLSKIEAAGVIGDEIIDRFIEAYGIPKEDQALFRERFSLSKNKGHDGAESTLISRRVAENGPALNHRQRARAIHPSPPDIIRG